MASANKQRVMDFIEKLFGLLIEVDGKQGMRSEELRALVEKDLDAAAGAVPLLLRAEEVQPGSRQMAYSVAAMYQVLTEDDSLTRQVQRAIESQGSRLPTFSAEDGQEPEAPKGQLAMLRVEEQDLDQCDVYNFVRIFKLDPEEKDKSVYKGFRGRCLLAFPSLDNDPRPVWQDARVRAFVRKLFEAIPYFPYYLHQAPVAGSFHLFFGCLAGEDAFAPAGPEVAKSGRWSRLLDSVKKSSDLRRRQGLAEWPQTEMINLNVMHPAVVAAVSVSVSAITRFCGLLGENPKPVLEDLLQPYPPELRTELIDSVLAASG